MCTRTAYKITLGAWPLIHVKYTSLMLIGSVPGSALKMSPETFEGNPGARVCLLTPVRASASKAKPKKVIHRKRTTRKHRAVRKSTRRHGKVSKTSRTSKHPVRKHRPVKHA